MIDLGNLEPIGRKLWVKKEWDKYEGSRNTLAIKRSIDTYSNPTAETFDNNMDKAKWKSAIDRKVNYLLARKPVAAKVQDRLDSLLSFIKDTAKQYLLRGSLIWIVQGNGIDLDPMPLIMNDTIAVYGDETKQDPVAIIRKYVDIEIDAQTGEEEVIELYECYYIANGVAKRDTWCYKVPTNDKEETLDETPLFIELGKTGDAPLFAYVENLLKAFDHILAHQDESTRKNTKPLIEVRGYSGTSDEELAYAIETLGLARTDGTGGVLVHSRAMDSESIDIWARRIMQEFYEATSTVGKENELAFAQSGKALDRLFVDAENSARELGGIIEEALVAYFEAIGHSGVDVIWNTDRPVDDEATINSIAVSRGLISDETLLEQHPWVDDPKEEMQKLSSQQMLGFEDLM